ncbi:MAG: histidine phosphatase family protein [Pseudomonadota bacterium]
MSLTTHTLTLLRHAKSDWGFEGLTDRQRPLNARGERDAPEMGKRLKASGVRPSLIVCSSAVRTTQTAKLFAKAIGFPIEFIHREASLYLASAHGILKTIAEHDNDFKNIVLVGHNPGISEVAEQLSDGLTDHLPTAAMLTVRADVPDWQSFAFGAIDVVSYDFPKNADGPITRRS